LPDIERDAAHDLAAAEAFLDAMRGEIRVPHGLAAIAVAALLPDRLRLLRRLSRPRGLRLRMLHVAMSLLRRARLRLPRGTARLGRTALKKREDIHPATSSRLIGSSL
jgi:hypothetical protein